jgi:pyruvate/2-oxoglutarate dehydrogenase complex dihydrolipoamide acyltransferase (E2) component
MVPGFEFLQTLMKTAGAALPGVPGVPGMSQWIAPTLDPEELEKRIQELKTVQFWLEQNAKLLGGTIQALEVQRMTLSTLKSLNLPMADLREALKINPAAALAASRPAPRPVPAPEPEPEPEPEGKTNASAAATPAVDPLQWWGALTQQFAEIATKAVTDSAADAAKNLVGAAVKQSVGAAGRTLKQTVARSAPVSPAARKTAAKAASASRKRGA